MQLQLECEKAIWKERLSQRNCHAEFCRLPNPAFARLAACRPIRFIRGGINCTPLDGKGCEFGIFAVWNALIANLCRPALIWLGLGGGDGLDDAEKDFGISAIGIAHFSIRCSQFQPVTKHHDLFRNAADIISLMPYPPKSAGGNQAVNSTRCRRLTTLPRF